MSAGEIPRHLAQASLVKQMLIEHGKERVSEPFIFEGRLYRITLERVPAEDVPAETQRFLQESRHDND